MTPLESLLLKLDSRLERHGPIWVVYPDEWKQISAALRYAMSVLSEDKVREEALSYSVYFEYLKALGEPG